VQRNPGYGAENDKIAHLVTNPDMSGLDAAVRHTEAGGCMKTTGRRRRIAQILLRS
jgi:hypothetical protein